MEPKKRVKCLLRKQTRAKGGEPLGPRDGRNELMPEEKRPILFSAALKIGYNIRHIHSTAMKGTKRIDFFRLAEDQS